MSWKTIVVGIDDTDSARRALECVAELAGDRSMKLVVTSVAPVLTGMAASHGIGPFDPADPPEQHQIELLHARDFLAEHNLEADLEFEAGDPAGGIIEAAEKHGADLIVVGTREPDLLHRLISGSVSQAVARKAHCDVLIVH
jgi:nucleotide-binding universal stress UspA family protein